MRQRYSFEGVAVFVAVAEAGSFSEAARRLGVSPSAVSQAVRALEEQVGAPLLRRSTRSVSLTDVGADYLLVAAPALSELRRAAEEAAGRGGRPAGPLRLTMPRAPFDLLVAQTLVAFQQSFPDVTLEISVERRMVDIVKEGYDAGLRYGAALDKDMVAIEVSPGSEAILVASPAYLDQREAIVSPEDLLDHRGLMCRSQVSGLIMPWSLRSAGRTVEVVPSRSAVVHDLTSQIDLAVKGLGVLSAPVAMVRGLVDAGALVRILPAWSSPLDAVHLYFPSRRHQSAALRAFVAFLKGRACGSEAPRL